MNRKSFAFVLALGLASASVAVAAQVYRWLDKDGVVHYGDRAPQGVEATLVGVKPNTIQISRPEPPAPAPEDAETAPAEAEAEPLSYAEQRRQDREERRRESREKARELEADCETMRERKAFLEPSPRVLVEDEDGTTRRLDDNERIRLLEEANTFLARNCRSN